MDSQHTQILELVTNSPNSLELPVIDSQLQSSVGPNAEPVITIELEPPEEIHEDNTPYLNIQPQNESEDNFLANYSLKKISHQSISKLLMTVFLVTRTLLMITTKLKQTPLMAICDRTKISN